MDLVRKAYRRAVKIPLENVQKLWENLEEFENKLNKITAKKFMNDLSPSFVQARQVLRELTTHINGLYPPGGGYVPGQTPEMYLPSLPTFSQEERGLIGRSKAYIKFEEGNPLVLEDDDKATYITRVQSVYRKAVIRMRYHPEFWFVHRSISPDVADDGITRFMPYVWTASVGKDDEALSILKSGMEANPSR
jgi:cleavage stimulation factor subunit 3